MALTILPAPPIALVAERPVTVGPHRPRKIGLVGGARESLALAPWQDPSWSFWSHASVAAILPLNRCDRFFDMHPRHCFEDGPKHGRMNYYKWLQRCPTPLYMQEAYPDIPAAVAYPLDQIRQLWPDTGFGSMAAYMIALALLEGVTHIGLWGIDYQNKSEYEEQRANCEHWVGIAKGMGVQITIPQASPLCHEPKLLYAYETHATPELYAARKAWVASFHKGQSVTDHTFDGGRLVPSDGEDGRTRAEKIRREKDPACQAAIDAMTDVEPEWLLELDRAGVPT